MDQPTARYHPGTRIELVRDLPDNLQIAHAIFDHDGTLSTLREGWEQVMEPMMIRAIMGPRNDDPAIEDEVRQAVLEFIDETTGVQTLVQMHGLVELVRRFGCVPEDQILSPQGYKDIYNDALLVEVDQRMGKLMRGGLNSEAFQIAGARAMLDALVARGVRLYLASGTDTDDVIREARAMGYADLFEGRIYGAVGDITTETKRRVMRQIIADHDLHELDGAGFVTFGDGPVEIEAARACGGVAVGIASDEVQRRGLNPAKRTRLLNSGADLIIPDFTEHAALLNLLAIT